MTRLVKAGLVARDWNAGTHRGMVTNSVVVLAVREGNPKGIRDWGDLVRDDVEVITPNPSTSGGARWNIMAAYGAASDEGRDHAAGLRYVRRLLANVSVQDKSARESLQTFAGGKGDVLIAYENEAITARAKGADLDYVIPADTILIENPIAVVRRSRSVGHARAFVDFLRSEPAQRLFAEMGYRPLLDAVADAPRFPRPAGLFTIDDLGGWTRVSDTFFDADRGLVNEIQRDLGNEVDG
jgi:sulfate/thiosulfate transport system substrate-binding protein